MRKGIIAAGLILLPGSVLANDSVYTKLDLDECTIVEQSDGEEGGSYYAAVCHGHAGIPVHVSEGDLRFSVVPLPRGYKGPVRFETLSPFNSLGETLEWRLDTKGEPIATIQRWFTDSGDGGPQRQVLVVTRVGEDGVCHVAHIDADSPNANELARQLADERTTGFVCGSDEVINR